MKKLLLCIILVVVGSGCTDEGVSKGEAEAKDTGLVSQQPVLVKEEYRGFNIIKSQGKHYGLAQSEGKLDLEKVGTKGYRCVVAESVEQVKRLIDKLVITELIEQLGVAESKRVVVEEGYKGFNIISYGGRFYGLAQSEGRLDLEKVGTKDYRCVVGESVGQVKHLVAQLAAEPIRGPGKSPPAADANERGDNATAQHNKAAVHSADSAGTGPYGAAMAFDGNLGSFWETSGPFPHWIQVDFGIHPKRVTEYTLQTGNHGKDGRDSTGRMPKDWRLEGSDDGKSWTVLDTQTNQTEWKVSERRTYSCTNSDSYRYYRLYVTAGINANLLRLYEVTFEAQAKPSSVIRTTETLREGAGEAAPNQGSRRSSEGSAGPNEPESFTLIVLPDTQYYTLNYPRIFTSQTQWIKDNKEAMNIVFVLHEGDVTQKNTDLEWERANTSMSVLDGVVPYVVCAGNHDVHNDGKSPADARDNTKLNRYFPVSRFVNEPWWGGFDPNNPDGRYVFFDAGGMEFMIISLEFGPNDAMLQWANQVVSRRSDKRVIFLTHSYTYQDDTRVGPGDLWGCRGWAGDGNDGEQMWDEFVKLHENIFLVLSGHILGDGLGRLTSRGVNGKLVHQILANYQDPPIPVGNGGNGWLRIMTFVPQEDRIEVRTYSPWLDEFANDKQNRFDLVYPMTGERVSP